MKNVMNNLKKVFLMVAIMSTVMGYANEKSFTITENDAKKTVLTLADVKVGNLFKIKDENGMVLYKETIQRKGTYSKGFDLTSLPDGSYFFELEKDMEISTIPFEVKANEVSFNKELAKTFFKPSTHTRGNMVFINQLSLNEMPLEIEVYYDGGVFTESYQLIHNETIANTKNIERVYELGDFEEGKYKIVFKSEGREFVKFI
ncbi:hypothetical protein CLV33_10372 [Jejuia pallidilutea]|uniref:Secreted protein (Por secretion system target) n=1 Tax=Jejuia pallidilutea TaxID=504487 RepID=A0A362X3N3_9FLAO|nr:hypothetical protein [Jejuia pallidilutea]PQV49442.1 hypothetical protein CLV33_10372 [Jejuia pallidilutea]